MGCTLTGCTVYHLLVEFRIKLNRNFLYFFVQIAQRMAKQAQMLLREQFRDIPITIDSVRESDSRSEGMGQGIM